MLQMAKSAVPLLGADWLRWSERSVSGLVHLSLLQRYAWCHRESDAGDQKTLIGCSVGCIISCYAYMAGYPCEGDRPAMVAYSSYKMQDACNQFYVVHMYAMLQDVSGSHRVCKNGYMVMLSIGALAGMLQCLQNARQLRLERRGPIGEAEGGGGVAGDEGAGGYTGVGIH